MRTVDKPWGEELIWAETETYVAKILKIEPGHRLSRQYHNVKEETFMVIHGVLTLEIGMGPQMTSHTLSVGSVYHCPPKTIHRMVCKPELNGTEAVQVMEVSTNHLDDVVRLEDDYKR